MNIALVSDYDNNPVAVVGHDPETGTVFFKTSIKFVSEILDILFKSEFRKEFEEDDITIVDDVKKTDQDYLEYAMGSLEKYKVSRYIENYDGELKNSVKKFFADFILEKDME
jgi:hypothetical protein